MVGTVRLLVERISRLYLVQCIMEFFATKFIRRWNGDQIFPRQPVSNSNLIDGKADHGATTSTNKKANKDSSSSTSNNNVEVRGQWSGRFDFIMACVGYAVGLGNVWRFPYLCYKNGGGAFLIPYMLMAMTSGVPLFFLEIALGQFTGQGCVTCWKICPIFKGIGYGIVVLCTWLNVYYIVVLAWSLLYFVSAFNFTALPWSHCQNAWNTPNCSTNHSLIAGDAFSADPVEEFWKRGILQLSDGIEQIGALNPWMVGALGVAWLLNYFIIWKGVKVSGKIVYFTAIFPYCMLMILLVRGVTLPGAAEGIKFYLKPNFTKIFEAQVWMDAGTQIFFSYAVSTGALIAMGSYNKFSNNCYRLINLDTWIVCVMNSLTSFLAGFCIFSILGYMAQEQGKDVRDVVADGPGLAFIAYPKALSTMEWAPFWSILFFLMLVFLGIDSQFVGLEGLFTALLDIWPELRHGYRPEIVMGLACLLSFLFGLLMCTQGGMWVFQLFDYYSASGFVLLWFCFFECIAITWVYGGQRFYSDIRAMIGFRISPWMLIAWSLIAPIICAIIFVVSLIEHEAIKVDGVQYPVWADSLGWVLALSSMSCIPLYAAIRFILSPGDTIAEKWEKCIQPELVKTVLMTPVNTMVDEEEDRPFKPIVEQPPEKESPEDHRF